MIQKNRNWILISFSALIASLLSLFLPVVTYTANRGADTGVKYAFNIFNLMDGQSFLKYMSSEYRGSFLYGMSSELVNTAIAVICVIAVAAMISSFIGLKCMAKQYESVWPFRLTLTGLICTGIPAIVILVVVLMSGDQFYGTVHAGAYVYVTTIAMIVSCVTVTRRHKLTQEELRIQKAASEYIRPAGNLPLQ